MSVNRRSEPKVGKRAPGKRRSGSPRPADKSAVWIGRSREKGGAVRKSTTLLAGSAVATAGVEEKRRRLNAEIRRRVDVFAGELEEMAARVVMEPAAASHDPFAEAGRLFAEVARDTLGDTPPHPDAVRRAALLAVADQAWAARLGKLLETKDVVQLLGVSKQRVSTLVRERRLLALAQDGRVRFPAWQFALSRAQDRECLAAAHEELVRTGSISPWTAASWFREPHPELDGTDPVTFLKEGGARARVKLVAERDAARLSQ